jgi:hypothetical protein
MRKAFQFCTGLYFQGEPISQQDWFHEALHANTRLEACYHPMYLDSLLVLSQGREGSFTATPTPRSRRLTVYSHTELMALRSQAKLSNERATYAYLGYRVAQQDAVDKIVTEAKTAKAKQAHGVQSNFADDAPAVVPLPSDGTDEAVRKLIDQRRSGAAMPR